MGWWDGLQADYEMCDDEDNRKAFLGMLLLVNGRLWYVGLWKG